MLRIRKVKLRNFYCYRDLEFDWERPGVNLIVGPNGSGKSTLIEAIVWGLFGKTLRGSRADDIVNYFAGRNCEVIIEGETNGVPFKVTRTRKHTRYGNALFFWLGTKYFDGRMSEVQFELEKALGVDFEHFVAVSVFVPDRMKLFATMSSSQRLMVLSDLLELNKFDRALELTRERLKNHEVQCRSVLSDIDNIVRIISILEYDITELETKKKKEEEAVENKRQAVLQELHKLEAEYREIEKQMNSLPPTDNLRNKINSLRNKKQDLISAIEDLHQKIGEITGKLKELSIERLQGYVGQPCPFCSQIILPDHVERMMVEMEVKRRELEVKKQALHEELENKQKAYHQVEHMLSVCEEEMFHVESVKNRYSTMLGMYKQRRKHLEARLLELNASLLQYDTILERKRSELQEYLEKKKVTELYYHQLLSDLEAYKIIRELFGTKGVRLIYIERLLELFGYEANYVLGILSNGRMGIKMELTEDDKLEVVVTKDGRKVYYEDCSAGERHRIECSLAIGLSLLFKKLGRIPPINFMFMDELFDRSLDQAGQEAVFNVLTWLRSLVPVIYVVSHRPELKNYFENIIEVQDGSLSL